MNDDGVIYNYYFVIVVVVSFTHVFCNNYILDSVCVDMPSVLGV